MKTEMKGFFRIKSGYQVNHRRGTKNSSSLAELYASQGKLFKLGKHGKEE